MGPTDHISIFIHFIYLIYIYKGCSMCYILWDGAYIKDILLLIKRVAHVVVAAGFLSRYLSGSLSYDRRHITVNKLCVCVCVCVCVSLNKHFVPSKIAVIFLSIYGVSP